MLWKNDPAVMSSDKYFEKVVTKGVFSMSSRVRCLALTLFLALIFFVAPVFARVSQGPDHPFDPEGALPAPDYADAANWAAVPADADALPVDVFYVHPTTYFGDEDWNQSMQLARADRKVTDLLTSQAGVFRDQASLYAPYYRQATIFVLNTAEDSPERQSLEIAYADVERAFEHYLENWNEGRPFILAGHSQGSNLILWLLERRFDDPTLREKLVAAYVIGWSVAGEDLEKYPQLKISESPDQIGCIISYNTQEVHPAATIVREGGIGVNPLTMTLTTEFVPAERNLGAVFFSGGGVQEIPHYSGGQTVGGALIVPRPFNAEQLNSDNPGFYHAYDYNFFYRNLMENVAVRVKAYLGK